MTNNIDCHSNKRHARFRFQIMTLFSRETQSAEHIYSYERLIRILLLGTFVVSYTILNAQGV